MQLTIEDRYVTDLREVLQSALGAVRMEISHTDNPAFRKELRVREEAIRAALAQFETAGDTGDA